MVDAVGSVKLVVQVALKIKEAADTVHQNKEVCHQIRSRVNRLRAILSKLQDADVINDPTMGDTLKDLEETLSRAYKLVVACQEEKNIGSLLFTAGKLSKQLCQVNNDILAQMAVASFGNNVQTTILLNKHFQDAVHPVPPEDSAQVGLASLFDENEEHVMSSSYSHSHHDARLETSEETGGAPKVKEPSRVPNLPHASLPWFTIFTYSQLRHATNRFSYLVGTGGSAYVYKGTLRDGRQVAVKRISYQPSYYDKEHFENEVRFGAMLQHVNILKLIGCSNTKKGSFLVYGFMGSGSLHDHIHGGMRYSVLPWPMRFQIVEGIAQGLLYLHNQCGLHIIHRDIKPANILLDDGYIPKIGDFGISHCADKEDSSIIGTFGFCAPEMIAGARISVKNDVYSYGVLLLETISGKHCYQASSNFNTLSAWGWHLWKAKRLSEFIDSRLGGVSDVSQMKEIKRCIHIALLCVEFDPAQRPTISDVLQMLSDKKMKLPIPQQPAGTDEDSSDYEQSD